jgi:DNA-binding MarR family transcriptional regulator
MKDGQFSQAFAPQVNSLWKEVTDRLEEEILEAITNAKFLKLNLAQIARWNSVPLDIVEQVAQALCQRHLGVDIEQLEFQSVVKQIENIEQMADAGMREWKLQALARRCRRTPKQLMEAFNKAVCQRAPMPIRHISEFKKEFRKEIEWMVSGWIPRGVTILLHGMGGDGKTLLLYNLLESILSGRPWNQYKVEKGSALLVQVDEPELITAERLDIRGIGDDAQLHILTDGWTVESLPRLEHQIAANPPTLMIIDSITAVNRNSIYSENDTEYARPILQIKEMARKYGITVLLIHHSNSDGNSRGTKAIHNSVDEVWGLSKVQGTDDRLLTIQKTRLGRAPGRYRFTLEEDFSFRYLGEQHGESFDGADPTLETKIRLWLSEPAQRGTAFAAIEVAECLQINKDSTRRTLYELWAKGLIQRRRPMGSPYYLYSVRGGQSAAQGGVAPMITPQPAPIQASTSSDQGDQADHQKFTIANQKKADHHDQADRSKPKPIKRQVLGGDQLPDHLPSSSPAKTALIENGRNISLDPRQCQLYPGDKVEILAGQFFGKHVLVVGYQPSGKVEVKGQDWAITQKYGRSNLRLLQRSPETTQKS